MSSRYHFNNIDLPRGLWPRPRRNVRTRFGFLFERMPRPPYRQLLPRSLPYMYSRSQTVRWVYFPYLGVNIQVGLPRGSVRANARVLQRVLQFYSANPSHPQSLKVINLVLRGNRKPFPHLIPLYAALRPAPGQVVPVLPGYDRYTPSQRARYDRAVGLSFMRRYRRARPFPPSASLTQSLDF